jgi:Lrp/AsnC family transcriptional regulator, leucine-responsive regulatory protein
MSNPQAPMLDEVDLRILAVLQQDASLENQDVATRVHLSPAACLRRVRKLREAGVIAAIVALVDASKLGLEVHAYAFVALENHHPSSGTQFENMIRRRPEVTECVRLSGTYDFMVRVVVASMSAYSEFLDAHLLPLPAVRSVSSSFELGVLKRTTALPTQARPPRGSAASR